MGSEDGHERRTPNIEHGTRADLPVSGAGQSHTGDGGEWGGAVRGPGDRPPPAIAAGSGRGYRFGSARHTSRRLRREPVNSMQREDERAEAVASYAYLANDAPARVPITETGGGRGGSGWPQGNGTRREGSLQAVSPLAGARSQSAGCRGGQAVSRRTPDGVSVSAPQPSRRCNSRATAGFEMSVSCV